MRQPFVTRSPTHRWLGPLLILLLLGIFGAGLCAYRDKLTRFYERHSTRLEEYSERGTALVGLMQIVSILNSNHASVGGAEVPNPYLDVSWGGDGQQRAVPDPPPPQLPVLALVFFPDSRCGDLRADGLLARGTF